MTASRGLSAPPMTALFREGFTPLELARLALATPALSRLPRGDGRPVLVFPGFSGGDASTLPLRAFLGRLGHAANGWGIGRNNGDVPALIPQLCELVQRAASRAGRPVRLVGWSLGGYLAREAARECPHAVERVVTLGSPITGGPKYTTVAPWYRLQGQDLDWIEAEVLRREETPLRVPVTAIYSRFDGVVDWRACVDERESVTENVEVTTTHLGMGISPEVFQVVARRLALPPSEAAPDR